MNLVNISLGKLIAAAGGDPWRVNATLRQGRPAQITELAQAFHDAGQCTAESSRAFLEARRRFEAAWNRENGQHPINDSAEVQRATGLLGVQTAQLPKIGTDLENVAATLAEAQRVAASLIATLQTQLESIDALIGHALARDEDADVAALERDAIDDTAATLRQIEHVRDDYAGALRASLTTLRADGYDAAAISGLDDDGQPTRDERDQRAVDAYNAEQRANDQSLVDSPGGMTPEKADAAARLRDDAAATDPGADPDVRRLASERLDDFTTARFIGPLPLDPMLGGDARSRAQMRLDWQKKLEDGLGGTPPMAPDRVTQMLDDSEARAHVMVTQQAVKTLEQQGMSPAGAAAVVGAASRGVPWKDLAGTGAKISEAAGTGIEQGARSASTGRHAVAALSVADVETLEKIGKRLHIAGTIGDAALGAYDVFHDDAPFWQTAGKVAGRAAGGYAAEVGAFALAGSAFGPEGALLAGIVGAVVLGSVGEKAGGAVGRVFDH